VTAILPLIGLFGIFHYTSWVPVGAVTERYGEYVHEGVARAERYFKRKGWFGFSNKDDTDTTEVEALESWTTDGRYRAVVEVALAYAITKALLPVRILASLWATPWFAGFLVRLRTVIGIKR